MCSVCDLGTDIYGQLQLSSWGQSWAGYILDLPDTQQCQATPQDQEG